MNRIKNLCLHTITTKPWDIETAAKKYREAGITGISVWRDALSDRDPVRIGKMLQSEGLEVISLVRGGFFPDINKTKRRQAIEQNREALEEAAAISAPMLVLVCGADPRQSLEDSRSQIYDGIMELIPYASGLGVKLGIEPLHPMYADTRSAINTIKQATDMAAMTKSEQVGVVVDVYHLWWDPDLEQGIMRCGELGKLFAYHICDWKVPTTDFLNDRGIMGEGCIPLSRIKGWVEAAGFHGYHEVEIFSNHYWKMDLDVYLSKIIEAFRQLQ